MSRRCQEGPAAAGWGVGVRTGAVHAGQAPGSYRCSAWGLLRPWRCLPTGRQAKGSSGPAGGGFRPPGGLLSPARTSRATRKPHPTP